MALGIEKKDSTANYNGFAKAAVKTVADRNKANKIFLWNNFQNATNIQTSYNEAEQEAVTKNLENQKEILKKLDKNMSKSTTNPYQETTNKQEEILKTLRTLNSPELEKRLEELDYWINL